MQFFPPEEMETVLDEFDRVLNPDGVLYITFKLGEGSKTTHDHGRDLERYLVSEDQARMMLTDRDFSIKRTERKELKWDLTVLNIFAVKE